MTKLSIPLFITLLFTYALTVYELARTSSPAIFYVLITIPTVYGLICSYLMSQCEEE